MRIEPANVAGRAVRSVWQRLRPGEAMLVVAAAVALVLLSADVAAGGLATYVDEQIIEALGPEEEPAGSALSSIGEAGFSGGALLIVALVSSQALWRLWPMGVAVGTVGAGSLLVLGLKQLLARTGPGESVLPDGYPGYFPSGHTATAGLCLGTACFLLVAWRGYGAGRGTPSTAGIIVGLGAAAAVGVGAVVGGHHWPTDALGGVLVTALVLPLGFAVGRSYVEIPRRDW